MFFILALSMILFSGIRLSLCLLSGAVFSLVMSNVGATVLLVPLAVSIAIAAGGDPAVFALRG